MKPQETGALSSTSPWYAWTNLHVIRSWIPNKNDLQKICDDADKATGLYGPIRFRTQPGLYRCMHASYPKLLELMPIIIKVSPFSIVIYAILQFQIHTIPCQTIPYTFFLGPTGGRTCMETVRSWISWSKGKRYICTAYTSWNCIFTCCFSVFFSRLSAQCDFFPPHRPTASPRLPDIRWPFFPPKAWSGWQVHPHLPSPTWLPNSTTPPCQLGWWPPVAALLEPTLRRRYCWTRLGWVKGRLAAWSSAWSSSVLSILARIRRSTVAGSFPLGSAKQELEIRAEIGEDGVSKQVNLLELQDDLVTNVDYSYKRSCKSSTGPVSAVCMLDIIILF